MPQIIIYDSEGKKHVLEASVGDSVMTIAVDNDIEGIVAECGGGCACATCHCYVAEDWIEKVGKAEEIEEEMLEFAESERKPSSRLSCQITITEEMDGLTITVPEEQ